MLRRLRLISLKWFCVSLDYRSSNKLEEKYQGELLNLKYSNSPGAREIIKSSSKYLLKNQVQQKNQLSMETLKDSIKQQDDEYKRLHRMAQQRREDEMEDELFNQKMIDNKLK